MVPMPMLLPNGSRNPMSRPEDWSLGGWVISTPLLTSSAWVASTSSVESAGQPAGDPNREPAHEAELGVGGDLQTEYADVELDGLVLVED